MQMLRTQIAYFRKLVSIFGLRDAMRLRLAQATRRPKVKLRFFNHELTIRPRGPDLDVALNGLGGEFAALEGLLPRDFDGLIVDAGGFIGSSALAFSEMFPDATIVAIEPSERNFELLRINTSKNPRIHLVRAALSSRAGDSVELYDRGTGDFGFSLLADSGEDEPLVLERVNTTTLEDILASYPNHAPGILKLDIEGAEKQIFEESGAQVDRFPIVLAELHERIVPGCDAAFAQFSSQRDMVRVGSEKVMSIDAALA